MEVSAESPELLYFIAGIVVFIIISALVEIIVRRKKSGDIERLSQDALKRGLSEYDIFLESTNKWNIKEPQVEIDFKAYLQKGWLPFYIRQHLRNL
jgi:hypothetical protein